MAGEGSALDQPEETEGLVRAPHLVALVVAAAGFMQSLDSTVITTALPQMALSFHVGPVDLSLGITAYIMAVAVLAPVSGWLANRVGARRVFVGAILLFTLASMLCGLAKGLWPFVVARVLQDVGGSMMLPVGQLILLRARRSETWSVPSRWRPPPRCWRR
jgi:MFS family permease